MDTISNKEATTQRDQELRTMEMLMAHKEINGGKKLPDLFYLSFMLK